MEESVKTTNSHRVYDINNQLLFEDDRLYITRIPYENGRQVGFSEKIDVTDEVMEAVLKAYYKKMDAAKQATIVRQLTTQL